MEEKGSLWAFFFFYCSKKHDLWNKRKVLKRMVLYVCPKGELSDLTITDKKGKEGNCMKKFWLAALSLLIVLAFFAGCAGTGHPSGASNAGEDGAAGDIPTLSVWSFTDELPTMISDYYLKDYPDAFVMDFTMVDSEEFEAKLDPALASRDAPDIWGINVAIVKKNMSRAASSRT